MKHKKSFDESDQLETHVEIINPIDITTNAPLKAENQSDEKINAEENSETGEAVGIHDTNLKPETEDQVDLVEHETTRQEDLKEQSSIAAVVELSNPDIQTTNKEKYTTGLSIEKIEEAEEKTD